MDDSNKFSRVKNNLDTLYSKVHSISNSAKIVAVSKKQPSTKIELAIKAGQSIFGENRVNEAKEKWTDLRKIYPDITLHLIGPLQTNKAKEAIKIFDIIETLDRPKLADELAKNMKIQSKWLDCFVQVNIGNEPQKAGIAIDETNNFVNYCLDLGIPVKGLMCIPPAGKDPRPYFKALKKLAIQNNLNQISMGMSGDFEIALEEGATEIRLGTAIFGKREL